MSNRLPSCTLDQLEAGQFEFDFSQLGLTCPMVAVTTVDAGALLDVDHQEAKDSDYKVETLDPQLAQAFYSLGSRVMSLLSGGSVVPVDYDSLPDTSSVRQRTNTSCDVRRQYKFTNDERQELGLLWGSDGSLHFDVNKPNINDVVVYGVHLTTSGSGLVRANLAHTLLGITNRIFVGDKNDMQQRELTAGDMHVFVRQGVAADPPVFPTQHHFTSDPGGRSFIESSFALEGSLRS